MQKELYKMWVYLESCVNNDSVCITVREIDEIEAQNTRKMVSRLPSSWKGLLSCSLL
jgi:hypothetical protein